MSKELTKKPWSKPTITETPIKPKGCLTTLLMLLSFAVMSQTVTITEGCSSGTNTTYVLPKTLLNDSGYNTYQSGNRLFEFNVVSKRWEYSVNGSILFFNKVKSAKPLPPCSFKFDYSHVNTCTDTTFDVLTDCTILPVELLYFTATTTPQGIVLKWKTASEQNNSHFEIEMSTDGKGFTQIARHEAKYAGYNYTYTHDNRLKGVLYYRLKQYDIDGKSTTFKVVSVSNDIKSITSLLDGVVYSDGRIEAYNTLGQLLATSENALNLYTLGLGVIVVKTREGVFKYLRD
jgi:hypothetical protein